MTKFSIHLQGVPPRSSLHKALTNSFREADALVLERLPMSGPAPSVKVKSDYWIIGGIEGKAKSADRVLISIKPDEERIMDIVQDNMKYVVGHEYHHCERMRGPGFGTTLGAALVSEGLAVQFEREMGRNQGGGMWSLHADPLTGEQFEEGLKRTRSLLNEPASVCNWILYGRSHQGPSAFGYRFGMALVNIYQAKNGNPRAAQLVHTPAAEILKAAFG